MNKITHQMLERQAETINSLLNTDVYYIGGAYGGHKLERTDGGRLPIDTGYTTKRDLHTQLSAFIAGIYAARK